MDSPAAQSQSQDTKTPSVFYGEDTMQYTSTRRPLAEPNSSHQPSVKARSSSDRPVPDTRQHVHPSRSRHLSPSRTSHSFFRIPYHRSSSRLRPSSPDRSQLDAFLRDAPPDDFLLHDPVKQRETSRERTCRLIRAEIRYERSSRWPNSRSQETTSPQPFKLEGGISGRDSLPEYDQPGPVWVVYPQRYYGDAAKLVRVSSRERRDGRAPSYPQGLTIYRDDEPGDRTRGEWTERAIDFFEGWR